MNAKPPHYQEYPQVYDKDMGATTVTIPQTQTITYVAEAAPERWSWCNLVTSVISFFCCSCLGMAATVMAILSYVDHKAKDYGRSKGKQKHAWRLAIAAFVLGIAVITLYVYIVINYQLPQYQSRQTSGLYPVNNDRN